MSKDEQLFNKIEDYLDGTLDKEVVAEFEKEITADRDLSKLVEMQRLEREAMDFFVADDLRSKIKNWDSAPPAIPDSPSTKKWYWAAVFVLLVVALGSYFMWPKSNKIMPSDTPPAMTPEQQQIPDPQIEQEPQNAPIAPKDEKKTVSPKTQVPMLYASVSTNGYMNTRPDFSTLTRGVGDSDNLLAVAAEQLNQNKPENAIIMLKPLLDNANKAIVEKANLLLAHANYQNGKYSEAANLFEKLPQNDDNQWFRLLCLVADYPSQKNAADQLITDILSQNYPDDPDNNHKYLKQTTEIKQTLSKGK
jgi:hypothetical protein